MVAAQTTTAIRINWHGNGNNSVATGAITFNWTAVR
jgi:hypothetical protein